MLAASPPRRNWSQSAWGHGSGPWEAFPEKNLGQTDAKPHITKVYA
jgi:hypothetical protein